MQGDGDQEHPRPLGEEAGHVGPHGRGGRHAVHDVRALQDVLLPRTLGLQNCFSEKGQTLPDLKGVST